jgi:hypothetical protein
VTTSILNFFRGMPDVRDLWRNVRRKRIRV